MSRRKLMMACETEFHIVPGIVPGLSSIGIKLKSFTEEVAQ
jgi:hypothetical protein